MKDQRLYAKFTLDFAENFKILPLSDAAFRCLVEATIWSRRQLTDGFLARRLATAKWPLEVLQELSTNDPLKPSLLEREDGWYIHDFDEHQDTRADIEARRERNKANGQKGGLAKAKRVGRRPAKPVASELGTEVLSDKLAETETEGARDFSSQNQSEDGSEPPLKCSIHQNHTDPPPCHKCRKARETNEQWHADDVARRRRANTAAAQALDDCTHCDEYGWLLVDGVVSERKCTIHLGKVG